MKTEEWRKVKDIVIGALEVDADGRREFIERQCGDSAEIRREVESLLAAEAGAEGFFEAPAIVNYAKFFHKEEDPEALAGQQVGNYRIVREIGHGGMGAVYLATRADGKFEQKVALKLLKRELNTASLRRRFEQERAILASLEHPNIARLLDAGTTEDKIPFLAMEYVEGLPIDDYCDRNDLDLNERLDLFRKVCAAVNFAHRNLVVHRDLKPSNILVSEDGIPKLLDFGISKIISNRQADSATVTRLGAMTPSYASPEQLRNKSVTTAADIYSLGVILYEILSGRRPFETKEGDFKEIYKAVLENDPPPPSSALMNTTRKKEFPGTAGEPGFFAKEVSGRGRQDTKSDKTRRTLPKAAGLSAGRLRGDLDNIVLKALRKEPERRYTSAENLAEDIHRHQRGLPVTARPNTIAYRAEKFFKRNKASAVAGILLVLAIMAGIVSTLWQSRVAAAERDRARLEAEKVKKINAYTQSILNFSNPHWLSSNPKRNRDAKISDALDEALKNIDADLAGQPEIQAEVLFTLGQTYTSQGQYEKAANLLRQSIEKFNQVLGSPNVKSMQANVILGDCLLLSAKIGEAEKLYVESIDYFRPRLAEDKSLVKWLAIAMNDLGLAFVIDGKYSEAENLYKESLALSENFTGKDRFIIPVILGNLARLRVMKGDFQEATALYNKALEELRLAGNESSFDAGGIYEVMGDSFVAMGDYKQADIHHRKAYDIYLKTVGEEAFHTLGMTARIAYNYCKLERFEEAATLIDKSLELQRKVFPDGHLLTASSERIKGEIFTKTGELKKGEAFLRKGLEYYLKNTKEPNGQISSAKGSLGENLIAQKRYAEAKEYINSAIEGSVKSFGEEHQATKRFRGLLSKIPNDQ